MGECPVHRGSVFQQLQQLFGQSHDRCMPLFLHGPAACGKTLTLRRVLQGRRVVHVTCGSCGSLAAVLDAVLAQLGCYDTPYRPKSRASLTMSNFVRILTNTLPDDATTYLVFDDAAALSETDVTALPALLRLDELVEQALVLVFVARTLPYDVMAHGGGWRAPLHLSVPPYSPAELPDVLLAMWQAQGVRKVDLPVELDDETDAELFQDCAKHVVSGAAKSTIDLRSLFRVACAVYPEYLRPLLDDPDISTHTLRTQCSAMLMSRIRGAPCLASAAVPGTEDVPEARHARILLLACFLASYNPAVLDERMFGDGDMRIKRRRTGGAAGSWKLSKTAASVLHPHDEGPAVFDVARALAIFHAIHPDPEPSTVLTYALFPTLVSMRLISRTSVAENLAAPRYACRIPLATANSIARSVSIDLSAYLHDPVSF